jgi:hypothetical protein
MTIHSSQMMRRLTDKEPKSLQKLLKGMETMTEAVLPKLVFTLLKNRLFSSRERSGDSRINASAFSCSSTYAVGAMSYQNEESKPTDIRSSL